MFCMVFLSFQCLTYAIHVFIAVFPVFRAINSWLWVVFHHQSIMVWPVYGGCQWNKQQWKGSYWVDYLTEIGAYRGEQASHNKTQPKEVQLPYWEAKRSTENQFQKGILSLKVGIWVWQSPNHEYGQIGNFKVYTTSTKVWVKLLLLLENAFKLNFEAL